MIDIREIIKNRHEIEKALLKRLDHIDFTELLEYDTARKELVTAIEQKLAERRKLSEEISRGMTNNQDVTALKEKVNLIMDEVQSKQQEEATYAEKIKNFLEQLPNIPENDVLPGGKENNQVVETIGTKPEFNFPARDHVTLAESLKLIDYKRGVKMGGARKWIYTGDGALLEWSLLNYFISTHLKNGYTFLLPPHLLNYNSGYVAGQFPKFKEDVFYVNSSEGDAGTFLLPTAETALVNFYADEIIPEDELPVKIFAYTPCYRKEGGGYGIKEKGVIRGNQFNKVELFHFAKPEESEASFQELLAIAKGLLTGLGIHYRVSKLAAKDCSASMAKTYDLEVWIPSMGEYKEVSSVSTAHTYQAIRGNIRYKDKKDKKNKFVHTLNGSALATSRLFPAILEQFQQADGSVAIPDVLRPFMGKNCLGG